MSKILVKPGVEFKIIAPGGARIIEALKAVVVALTNFPDLTLTSGTDGIHSGPTDPHYRGEAYDLRSQNLTAGQKAVFLALLSRLLGDHFYAFLENPGLPNEHFHVQVKKGTSYSAEDLLKNA